MKLTFIRERAEFKRGSSQLSSRRNLSACREISFAGKNLEASLFEGNSDEILNAGSLLLTLFAHLKRAAPRAIRPRERPDDFAQLKCGGCSRPRLRKGR
jgi:hypothetical protein